MIEFLKGYKRVNQHAWKSPRGKIIKNDDYENRLYKAELKYLERQAIDYDRKPSISKKISPKKKSNVQRSSFKSQKTRTKVKSPFPKEIGGFFYSDKNTILFSRAINVKSEDDRPRVAKKLDECFLILKPWFQSKIKPRKNNSLNIGYIIQMKIATKTKPFYIMIPNHKKASYVIGFKTRSKNFDLDRFKKDMMQLIFKRFSEYLQRKDFRQLRLLGFEGEISHV
jgi:hypothetical protein